MHLERKDSSTQTQQGDIVVKPQSCIQVIMVATPPGYIQVIQW